VGDLDRHSEVIKMEGQSSIKRTLRRREVLGGIGLAATALIGGVSCSPPSSNSPDGTRQSGGKATEGLELKESPQLAEQVKAGKLPPLEQRLPPKPMVITPLDEFGQYGGTWHTFGDRPPLNLEATILYDWLVRWNPEWTEVIPNLAESWDVDSGGKQFTFHLRQGVKWSDGEPWTADDLVFAYNDILLNDKLFPSGPPWQFLTGGEPGRLRKLDKYTIRFEFSQPNGLFLEALASWVDQSLVTAPRHYLVQFHIKYNPNAGKVAKEAGFDSWYDYFLDRRNLATTEIPVLFGWKTSEVGSRMVFERNPYYWKTDTKGRQLPYIDTQVKTLVQSSETALLQASQGEFEFLNPTFFNPNLGTPNNKPVLAKSRATGKFHFVEGISSTMNMAVIAFNLNCKNEGLRSVFQNRDFRIGMSYAINRPEIIDAVYQRQGEPWQAMPRKESDFYVEQFAKQYTEYDPKKANEYLDKAGYTQRDSEGFRLRSDGDRISFKVQVVTQEPTEIDNLQLVSGYWKTVGVDMSLDTIDRSLFYSRKAANEFDASVWTGDGGMRDAILEPRWYFPFSAESNFALRWAAWYTSRGADGDEPTEAAKQQMSLYDKLRAEIEYSKRRDYLMQILDIAAEQFWVIGTVLPVGNFGIQTDNFHNVPKSMIAGGLYPTPGPTYPEQYYMTS
jgi:ABC-type transport system substrate-binding protein